jgi:hypothetical protein
MLEGRLDLLQLPTALFAGSNSTTIHLFTNRASLSGLLLRDLTAMPFLSRWLGCVSSRWEQYASANATVSTAAHQSVDADVFTFCAKLSEARLSTQFTFTAWPLGEGGQTRIGTERRAPPITGTMIPTLPVTDVVQSNAPLMA